MKRSDLDYDLPPDLIAQRPCEPRDAARLMVLDRASGRITHRLFRNLPEYLRSGDCLVVNTTKVLPARFEARRATGGRIEGLFLAETGPGAWRVLLQGVGRLNANETLILADPRWTMTFMRRFERGEADVRIAPPDPATAVLAQIGLAPLPPYIRRDGADARDLVTQDRADYQTVYAEQPGAIAAPTAGMHFTPQLMAAIRQAGVSVQSVVLHTGIGTFSPIEADLLAEHHMHREWYSLSADAASALSRVRAGGGRIIAVGTTSVRVLETCAGEWRPQEGRTDIFIYPPYEFRAVDALVTNFHLPGSTLLALVCALAGRDVVMQAYAAAISERYRFYSYGDAMLIL